jgi:hypothetical protein
VQEEQDWQQDQVENQENLFKIAECLLRASGIEVNCYGKLSPGSGGGGSGVKRGEFEFAFGLGGNRSAGFTSPLLAASSRGTDMSGVVRALLAAPGIDVNSGPDRVKWQNTALRFWLAESKIVELFLKTPGIDVCVQNDHDATFLILCLCGEYEASALEFLKIPEVDIYAKDDGGRTALDFAVEKRHTGALKALLARMGPESVGRARGLYDGCRERR